MSANALRKTEQHHAIHFCFRLGKSVPETVEMLRQAYQNNCLNKRTIFRWYSSFREGRQSGELTPHGGRPVTASTDVLVNTISAIINEDGSLTCEEIAQAVDISKSTVHNILKKKLGLRRVSAKWVPHLLTTEQLARRVEVCKQWKMILEADPNYLSHVITGDETWAYYHDPLTKKESSAWKHPQQSRREKVRQAKSAGKVMIIAFFDDTGMIYQHQVPSKTTVNSEYYIRVLKNLRKHVQRKRPSISKTWVLHHDNARPHTAHKVTEFLAKYGIRTFPQPPYSPDLAPCDFALFPKLKEELRGRRFSSDQEVVNTVQGVFKQLDSKFFKDTYERWQNRWNRCIKAQGHYFERS